MKKVEAFLTKYKMHYNHLSIDEEVNKFIKEMEAGLKNEASSLKMLPTYLSSTDDKYTDKKVVVIDAGGTNFRVGIVAFDAFNKPCIEDFHKYEMLGTEEEVGKEQFFETMAEYVKEVAAKGEDIGFCFSYAVEIGEDKDGTLLKWSKEIKAPEVIGEKIGSNLLKALKKIDNKERKVVLLNDTVATLLGGKGVTSYRKFDSYIGFIFGTGTNTCYIEENKNIEKVGHLQENGNMIINIESGAYDKLKRGEIDELFDQTTKDPGEYVFEKMASGAYLGGLILKLLHKASEEDLFLEETNRKISKLKELSLITINDFMRNPYDMENKLTEVISSEQDRTSMYEIIVAMIERAAFMSAIKLIGIILKTNKGTNPCQPVAIVAEGTTFYKLKYYKESLDRYMKNYLTLEKKRYYEFIQGEELNFIGSAIAILSTLNPMVRKQSTILKL